MENDCMFTIWYKCRPEWDEIRLECISGRGDRTFNTNCLDGFIQRCDEGLHLVVFARNLREAIEKFWKKYEEYMAEGEGDGR